MGPVHLPFEKEQKQTAAVRSEALPPDPDLPGDTPTSAIFSAAAVQQVLSLPLLTVLRGLETAESVTRQLPTYS